MSLPNVAKYRPHRPRRHECSDLQDFLAGDRYTDRHDKYRPRIDRLEMSRFAGISP
jgi:hypothetical protein